MGTRRAPTFEDGVLALVRNLVEYRRYGGDEKRAIRTLCAHHPDVAPPVCEKAFRSYASAYRDAIAFVDANSGFYCERRDSPGPNALDEVPAPERTYIDTHPDVPPGVLRTMVFWVFDWHHAR
jgi:hypothetical protein